MSLTRPTRHHPVGRGREASALLPLLLAAAIYSPRTYVVITCTASSDSYAAHVPHSPQVKLPTELRQVEYAVGLMDLKRVLDIVEEEVVDGDEEELASPDAKRRRTLLK